MKACLSILLFSATASAAIPPPVSFYDFPLNYAADAPGEFAADALLAKPAGAAGPVVAADGHFFTGSPRRRIRFLGVNLCFGANFPPHAQADELARRLARFGINIVRFHHMDSQPFPGGIFSDRSLDTLSGEALDRLDYLIAALKREGIYSNLNLHVSRSYARSHQLENADKAPNMDKAIDLFDPVLIESQKSYARDLLTHVNAYTHAAYASEPAVAMIEINNENTFFIWGGEQNLQSMPDPYAAELRDLWNGWLHEKYLTEQALLAAWNAHEPDRPVLAATESFAQNTIACKTKNVPMVPARAHDWYDFLQQQDEKYFHAMYAYLKNDLHVQAPVTGTIGLGALGTLTQTHTDFVDAHDYWQHPTFAHKEWSVTDYTMPNTPMVDSPTLGTFPALAAIRVAGKPFTVTEYDHPAPNEYRAEALPMLASMAALQDWDALYIFAYSHSVNYQRDHTDSFFDLAADPGPLAMMPVAARIFLGSAVAPLPAVSPIAVSREESLTNAGRFYFTLWPQLQNLHQLSPSSLLHQQLAITFDTPEGQRATPAEDHRMTWRATAPGSGQFQLVDSHAAVFVGFPPADQGLPLGPLSLARVHGFVVATLMPMDSAQPLATASHLLLTVMGRVQNPGQEWNDSRTSLAGHWGTGPTQLEVLQGVVNVPAEYTVVPLEPAGHAQAALPAGPLELSKVTTPWFRLDRRASPTE